MDVEELKTHINAALEPLLQRITALQNENQQIRAILKSLPQPKPATKPATTINTPNTTSTKKILPASKPHEAEKKPAQKKETHKVEQQKQEHLENGEHVEGQSKTTEPAQKKQPVNKTVGPGPKKIGTTQPDPKNLPKTPHVEKKNPVTQAGRPSVGNDKANQKNVKTKTQAKQEQGEKNDTKQDQKTHHGEKTAHHKPTDHKAPAVGAGVKGKPSTTTHTNSKKQLPVTEKKKTQQHSQQKKPQATEKPEPALQNLQKPAQQKAQSKSQQKNENASQQIKAESTQKQPETAVVSQNQETAVVEQQPKAEQHVKSDQKVAQTGKQEVPTEQTA